LYAQFDVMYSCARLLLIMQILPAIVFSQVKDDSVSVNHSKNFLSPRHYPEDSTFSILANISTVFYTANDSKIDNFLVKYGYNAPQKIPLGVNIELAAVPFESKMTFTISGSTIVSKQDIVTAEFKIGAYRRFFEREHFWISAGLGLGTHGSRIILDGNMPPHFDSLAAQYGKQLALRTTGFVVEPGVRFFWYPLQTRRFQLGIFANPAYDFSFNTRWKLGYYNDSRQSSSFKDISKNSDVQNSHKEFGWALGDGLSFCFKFD
jgi:hypothetical protein